MALPPNPVAIEITTAGPDDTRAVAAAVAPLLDDGDLLVLTGDLGAGKTCFTQGLGRALGVVDRITSPTFTIASEYEGRLRLHHLDVYRLDGPADTGDLDLPELAEQGVTVIEWGERIDDALAGDRLTVEMTFGAGDDDRVLVIIGTGSSWADRAEALRWALARWTGPC